MLIDTEDALISADVFFGHGYDCAHDEAVALVLTAADRSPTDTGTEILEVEYPEHARQAPKGLCQQALRRAIALGVHHSCCLAGPSLL
jgi:hypothetical protein